MVTHIMETMGKDTGMGKGVNRFGNTGQSSSSPPGPKVSGLFTSSLSSPSSLGKQGEGSTQCQWHSPIIRHGHCQGSLTA